MQRGEYNKLLCDRYVLDSSVVNLYIQRMISFQCYDEKGREAAYAMDDDIRPWLKSFVESVGYETAKYLLTGAGEFDIVDEAMNSGRL